MYYASNHRNGKIDFTAGNHDRLPATLAFLAIFILYFLVSSLTVAK